MKKRYWLRGGITTCCAIVIIYILLVAFNSKFLCEYNDIQNIVCNGTDVFQTFFGLVNPFVSFEIFGLVILVLLVIFAIGAVIGWIYGKMKSK